MELQRTDIRKLLRYEFLRGTSTSEAMKRINEAEGAQIVGRSAAYKWYAKFKSGDLSVEDVHRTGRPQIVDRVGVINTIEEDPTLDTRSLAGFFDCSHTEIEKILHKEGIEKFR